MVFIPPPHVRRQKEGRPATQHETTVGLFVVFVILLCIALFFLIAGPRSDNPPPLGLGLGATGFAVLFGIIAFFSWMKEQGDPDTSGSDNQSSEQ
jgi:drug/metabolite transporter (DMT)-like permease